LASLGNNGGDTSNPAGDVKVVSGSRNGNLQDIQFFYGAAEPSNPAALAAQALFLGSTNGNGSPLSSQNIITPGQAGYGDIYWSRTNTLTRPTGAGIGTVQSDDSGAIYRFKIPSEVDNGVSTDFFQRNEISRTFNLLQSTAGQTDPASGFQI